MRSFFSVLTLLVVITVAYGYPPFICTLPRDRGNGIQRLINFYYDPATNDCVEFLFYGRGGNRNRFFSKKKCINFCRVNITLTLPDAIQQQPETASTILPNSVSASETTCNLPLPPSRDWPKNSKTAYAFDSKANQCFYVYYDEETLNANNFPTREACLAFCGDASPTEQQFTQAICSLPPPPTKEWPQNSTVGFWFDEKNDRCEPIYYDEATKNANNFNSVEKCLKTCSTSSFPTPEPSQPENPTTTFEPLQDDIVPELKNVTMNPRNEERDRICNLPAPPNRDWVSHEYTGYHYDAETEECDLVYYDLITKNDNLFPSLDECLDFCLPTESDSKQNNSKLTTTERTTTSSTKLPSSPSTSTAPKTTTSITTKPTTTKPQKLSTKDVLKLPECSLQPQPGHCKALIHSYYFNITTMRCQQYIYGGCGATANHYLTEAKCEQSCVYRKSKPRHPIIVTPSEPLRPKKDKYCKIPIYDNNCMHRSHQGFLFQPSTNSCHFTVVNRCSRPLALHKRREACVASCVRATPGIFKIPLFRSKSN